MRLTTRKRLYIDKQVQGTLLRRIVGYWFFLAAIASLILLGIEAIREPGGNLLRQYFGVLSDYWLAAVATLAVLPVVLYDVIAISNRFVGPVYRLRRAIRALTAGEHVAPVQFREKDCWRDLADEFNALAAYVDELNEQVARSQRDTTREFQPVTSE